MRNARRAGAMVAATVLVGLLSAAPVLAGNFAEVVMTSGADKPPIAGEEHDVRFTLLQHGVTPVNTGPVRLIATEAGSNDRIEVDATSLGSGEWVATITLPREGEWQIQVRHAVFETSPPTTLEVTGAGLAGGSMALGVTAAGLVAVALIGLALVARRRAPARREAVEAPTRV